MPNLSVSILQLFDEFHKAILVKYLIFLLFFPWRKKILVLFIENIDEYLLMKQVLLEIPELSYAESTNYMHQILHYTNCSSILIEQLPVYLLLLVTEILLILYMYFLHFDMLYLLLHDLIEADDVFDFEIMSYDAVFSGNLQCIHKLNQGLVLNLIFRFYLRAFQEIHGGSKLAKQVVDFFNAFLVKDSV